MTSIGFNPSNAALGFNSQVPIVAVIMISSEMPEVLGMSDRIMVVHEGRVTGFLDRSEADQVKIMELASH